MDVIEVQPPDGADRDVLERAARCLSTALVRGYAGARELSDCLAAARVRLPLLNWPTSALLPLEIVVAS